MINQYPKIELEIGCIVNKIQTAIIDKLNTDCEMVLSTLYKRIINGYYSINLLVINGFNLEALTIMRSCIECKMIMTSVIKNPNQALEKLRLLTENNLREYIESARKLDKDYCKIKVTHLNNRRIGIREISKINYKLNRYSYEWEYSELCNIVHINKSSLEMMLVKIEDKIALAENISIDVVQSFYDKFISEIAVTFLQMYDVLKIEIDGNLKNLCELSKSLLAGDLEIKCDNSQI